MTVTTFPACPRSYKIDTLGRRNRGWSKPGPGREKVYKEQFTFMADAAMTEAIKAVQKRLGKASTSEALRTIIQWGLDSQDA